jgi:D-3-phosphoglycerate dehydrogenase / 2-oxoglutarate reductase
MSTKIDGVRYLQGRFKKALILENPHPTLDRYLASQGIKPQRLPETATQNEDEVVRILQEGQHDLIFKRSRFEVNERVLRASDNLAAIMLCCIGDDSVDKEACAREGVLVMNDPISNGRSVVEMVFGEMICLARRIFHAAARTQEHVWTKDSKQRYELKGKNLVIIGLGNIGKQVAQMGELFGMRIFFYDNRELAREVGRALGWTSCETLMDAFRLADVMTVHVSAEDTRGISNKDLFTYQHFSQFGSERNGQSPRIFINAARGFLYEPEDLKHAVREGVIRYAAIDVFPDEPGSSKDQWTNPYSDVEEIIATPHIGAATEEAQPRIAQHIANTAQLFDTKGAVRDCVYSPGVTIGVDTDEADYVLTVVHSDSRGTKKAVDDAIFEAGLNNIQSSHRDFPKYGFAYDVNAIDRPLTQEQLLKLVKSARELSKDPFAIRAVRQISVR